MATYMLTDGMGDQITDGLSEETARTIAQELADERRETVYLYLSGEWDESEEPEEPEEFAPSL